MAQVGTKARSAFYFEPILADMRDVHLSDTRPWIVGEDAA